MKTLSLRVFTNWQHHWSHLLMLLSNLIFLCLSHDRSHTCHPAVSNKRNSVCMKMAFHSSTFPTPATLFLLFFVMFTAVQKANQWPAFGTVLTPTSLVEAGEASWKTPKRFWKLKGKNQKPYLNLTVAHLLFKVIFFGTSSFQYSFFNLLLLFWSLSLCDFTFGPLTCAKSNHQLLF